MNLRSEVESKSFKTFTTFTLIVLIILALLVTIFSSKYRVSNIIYNDELNLNYESMQSIENLSIWLINDDNFQKLYEDNLNVKNLEISKQLPNTINININLHQKIIIYTDLRDSSPSQMILYKNLYTENFISEHDLPNLIITNGPIEDGFYSEVISFILTVEKYKIDLSNLSITFNGNDFLISYSDTIINAGKPVDLSRKGSVVGYILENDKCEGTVSILDTANDDIETLFQC